MSNEDLLVKIKNECGLRFGYRYQAELLSDSLKTKKYISFKKFKNMLDDYHYFYYDVRCDQFLFIAKDMSANIPTWLFVEWRA